MDISEKQAKWRQERPLFEAELIHSHLLPFFNFNENTGDYEIKVESVANSDDEDRKFAYETLNTGWAMWLRAKRNAKAVPESNALLSASLDAIKKLGSGDFVLIPRVITDEWISIYIDPAVNNYCKEFEGLPFSVKDEDLPSVQEDFRRPIRNAHKQLMQVIEAQEQGHD